MVSQRNELASSVDKIFAPIAKDMLLLDSILRDSLISEVHLIQKVLDYVFSASGKRLRPAVLLLFAQALNYQGTEHHLLASIVECIHTATLLHDDVVDISTLRRGRETANKIFGNAASILVGDFLYSRSFQMMVKVADGPGLIMKILSEATNAISEGEVLQLLHLHETRVTEIEYMKVIDLKTAKLFAAAAELGAVLAHADSKTRNAAILYGKNLGAAFQIIDDMLDYSSDNDKIGKNIGKDLNEGKLTLPLIFLLKNGTLAQKNLIKMAIKDGGNENFEDILEVVKSTGALIYTRKCAARQAEKAFAAIDNLPASKYKTSLIALCSFAVERQF